MCSVAAVALRVISISVQKKKKKGTEKFCLFIYIHREHTMASRKEVDALEEEILSLTDHGANSNKVLTSLINYGVNY
jgi:hypothetical protein